MQNTLKPRLRDPQVVIVASDHGLAVDGLPGATSRSTSEQVEQLLSAQLPVGVFARIQGMHLSAVDAGVAQRLQPHDRLLMRKIAHGTRNARVNAAMSVDQAHAAIRAGMEIGDALRGNMVACAGIGVGSHESSALVMSRLADAPVLDLLVSGPQMNQEALAHLMAVMQGAQARHRDLVDPVEVLAAFGGFEIAMLVGLMLVAASKRHLVMVDGMAACAALMVASRIAAPVTDYCVFCRSHRHQGLDAALHLFRAAPLLELGMDSTDGTGATLAWPLIKSAAALLTEVAEGEDPGPSRPSGFTASSGWSTTPGVLDPAK
jgi:nicotinate-nucleotide--dimethylbenzimidazole phosphoribosyltransferase